LLLSASGFWRLRSLWIGTTEESNPSRSLMGDMVVALFSRLMELPVKSRRRSSARSRSLISSRRLIANPDAMTSTRSPARRLD
jgi:hypothetical protein